MRRKTLLRTLVEPPSLDESGRFVNGTLVPGRGGWQEAQQGSDFIGKRAHSPWRRDSFPSSAHVVAHLLHESPELADLVLERRDT